MHDPIGYLNDLPQDVNAALEMFSVAESLTDDVASKILELNPIAGISADRFLRLLHSTNYVIPRNGEWYIEPTFRRVMLARAKSSSLDLSKVHELLRKLGEQHDTSLTREAIPSYLFTNAGRAYHSAALGHIRESLSEYAQSAMGEDEGELTLAASLAMEQRTNGVLPHDAIEPDFLMGMSRYRNHDRDGAFPFLLRVAQSKEIRSEVALSRHLLGTIVARQGRQDDALTWFAESLRVYQRLKLPHSSAYVLNSRAAVLRDLGMLGEAADDLEEGLALASESSVAVLLTTRATVRRAEGNPKGALDDLNKAFEKSSDDDKLPILISRAAVKRELGDLSGAVADLDLVEKRVGGEQRVRALYHRANLKHNLGDLNGAIEDLDTALRITRPQGRAGILNSLSFVKRDCGDLHGALKVIDELLALSDDVVLRLDRRALTDRRKNIANALRRIETSVDAEEQRRQWFRFLSRTAKDYLALDLPHRAIWMFRMADDLSSNDQDRATCSFGIGQGLRKIGRGAEAIEYLKVAATLVADNSAYLATYAHSMDEEGFPLEITQPIFENAIDLNDDNFWAKSWFALALSRAGLINEAESLAREAMLNEKASSHPIIMFNLARILDVFDDQERQSEARLLARQAMAIALPNFDLPRKFLLSKGEI